MSISLRYCLDYELRDLIRIERLCFAEPWTRREFQPFIERSRVLVAECNATLDILGFAAYEVSRGEVRIVNMAVEPVAQRRGVGLALVNRLKDKLCPWKRRVLTALVPETNLAAHLFLRSCGFRGSVDPNGYLFRFDVADVPPPTLRLYKPSGA